jgi:hypothetical protein
MNYSTGSEKNSHNLVSIEITHTLKIISDFAVFINLILLIGIEIRIIIFSNS